MCLQCHTKLPKRAAIECICRRVRFCSPACQQLALSANGRHADCTGAPEAKIDLGQVSQRAANEVPTSHYEQWQAEYYRTVLEPAKRGGIRSATVEEYIRVAEKGNGPANVAAAYMAGVALKKGMVGTPVYGRDGSLSLDRSTHSIGALDSLALSIKYLSLAAENGLPLSMQSLGESYYEGKGVRKDTQLAADWTWRAALNESVGAFDAVEKMCVIPLEILATIESCKRFRGSPVDRGDGVFSPFGPNLGSLLLSLYKPLQTIGYVLPPFAADMPGSSQRTGPVPIIGATRLRVMARILEQMEQKANGAKVDPGYGRRGTAAAATLGALGSGRTTRPLDAQRFVSPPIPASDELPEVEDVIKWAQSATSSSVCVECVHTEQPMLTEPRDCRRTQGIACTECLAAACVRLQSTARRAVLLSLDEVLPGRGNMAIYKNGDDVVSETYKRYSRGEIEVVLGALAATSDTSLAHPVFIAADPNLFWPCIFYHGSVRAALGHVAPHVDWTARFGEPRAVPPPEPLHSAVAIESPNESDVVLTRCGADACLKVQCASEKIFHECAQCRRRLYCSKVCQKADWVLHKHECTASSRASAVSAAQPDDAVCEAVTAPLGSGEEVVVYGLKSKPEFNGCLGRVSGDLTNGRYPIDVRPAAASWLEWGLGREPSRRTLAVQESNLHRLGVRVIERSRSRKFVCCAHGREGSCEECCTDLTLANHLSKLRQLSQGEQTQVSRDLCERVASNHFAAKHAVERDTDDDGNLKQLEEGELLEVQGVPAGPRREALKAALNVSELTLAVAAARAGMVCFGASKLLVAERSAVSHLEALLNM